jgi:hypothetical protein
VQGHGELAQSVQGRLSQAGFIIRAVVEKARAKTIRLGVHYLGTAKEIICLILKRPALTQHLVRGQEAMAIRILKVQHLIKMEISWGERM